VESQIGASRNEWPYIKGAPLLAKTARAKISPVLLEFCQKQVIPLPGNDFLRLNNPWVNGDGD
jgi:hypothetical protein